MVDRAVLPIHIVAAAKRVEIRLLQLLLFLNFLIIRHIISPTFPKIYSTAQLTSQEPHILIA